MSNIIKIVSDGTPQKTVVTQEDGTEIKGIKRLYWVIDAEQSFARAVLEFDARIEAKADAAGMRRSE